MFTHLNIKSGYSLLRSTIKIDELVQKAKRDGQKAIALTDYHSMYGTIPFVQACMREGIRPIIGLTTTVIHTDGKEDQVVLLAKNNRGYQQLLKIATRLGTADEQRAIEIEILQDKIDGLIAILSFEDSSVYYSLQSQQFEDLSNHFQRYRKIFSQEDFYIGITDIDTLVRHHVDVLFKQFLKEHQLHACALIDCVYLEEQDAYIYECLQAIRQERLFQLELIGQQPAYVRHFLTNEEASEQFERWPELIEQTSLIANRCDVHLEFGKKMLPAYPLNEGETAASYLRKLTFQCAKEKYGRLTEEITNRLNEELVIIDEMGFNDYFLIVWDFIAYARKNHIAVGPGRGSSAGSLVSYVLRITDVDPLKYNLLFERFLNPERSTMPDIDIDFEDTRRDEVIKYVSERYGEEHVAQIVTFGTFLARSIMRELFKVLDVSQRDSEYILREITKQGQKRVAHYVRDSKTLRDYVMRSEKLKILFRIATKLSGLPRHVSTHAAGVIISKERLSDHVPLLKGTQTIQLTQYAMSDLESLGLLKMDFLGLRNLTFLKEVIESIRRDVDETFDLKCIKPDDHKTYRLLQLGLTNSIFQLESYGMKRVLRTLKPTQFADIVAVNALYRPGPMNFIQTYIRRKHGREEPIYPHEDLKPILKETYGVLVYQEQIMQIAHIIAGYSLAEADVLRRAISKKDNELLEGERQQFIDRCLKRGYEEAVATELFHWIVQFSNYGFNKSHAVAYSKIAYQLSYLKANYPAQFFEGMYNTLGQKHDKLKQYREEGKFLNVELVGPCVNRSHSTYRASGSTIRMGIQSIKGVSRVVGEEIVKTRKENGPFESLFDFCLRIDLKIVTREIIEKLILAGAFDLFSENRKAHLQAVDRAIEQGILFKEFLEIDRSYQSQLDSSLPKVDDIPLIQKLKDEKTLLGIYVSSHPLEQYRERLTSQGVLTLRESRKYLELGRQKSCVMIQRIKEIRTKKGKKMAFLTLEDETGEMEGVIFPDDYERVQAHLKEETLVCIQGTISKRQQKLQWIIQQISLFSEGDTSLAERRLFIRISTKEQEREALAYIRQLATQAEHRVPVILYNARTEKTYRLSSEYAVSIADETMKKIKTYFGTDNVILK